MPYCSRCGVEVDKNVIKCPLCRTPIQKFPEEQDCRRYPQDVPHVHPKDPMSLKDKVRLVSTITTFGFLIPCFLVLAIDYFQNRSFTWSRYALSSLLLAWFWTLIPLLLLRKPFLIILFSFVSGSGFLFFLDHLTSSPSWFLSLGLPVLGTVSVVASLVLLLIRSSKRKGINIAGFIILGVCACSLMIDFWLSLYSPEKMSLSWSLIVTGAGIPVSGLLFYLHRIAGRKSRIKSFFHL